MGQRDVTEYGAVRVHLVYMAEAGASVERVVTVEEAIRFWLNENGVETDGHKVVGDFLRVEQPDGPTFLAPLVRLH